VDVLANVPLARQQRRPGVNAHPHREPEPVLRVAGSGKRARRRRKHDEERVALRVDLDTVLLLVRLAHDPAVLVERSGIPLSAELVQQPRRALDVGEEKGDGAAR
jgi:hypothetical protein